MSPKKDALPGAPARTVDLAEEQEVAVEPADESASDPYAGPANSELRAGDHNARYLYETALGALPTGVIHLCADGAFLGATSAMERMLGHPPGWEPPEGGLLELVHPDDQEVGIAALARLAGDPDLEPWDSTTDSVDLRVLNADGDYRWLEARGTDLRQDPQVAGYLVSFTDVTSRVEATQYRSQFFRTAAHELRAPVATMLGRLDILEATLEKVKVDLPSTAPATVEHLRSSALRMQRLVGDLMDSARMDSGEFNLVRRENVDLAALITKEIADLAVEAGERNVTITKRVTPGPKVTVDSVRIGQVIANLLSNACRYCTNGGAVMVTADPTRDGWCIRFVDTGIGMDAETVARLGEPLFRSERAKEHAVGTGLGFAVTKGIVEAHGGTIAVQSELDRGTTVTVLLPYETA